MEQQNEVKVASLLELETLEKGLYRGQSWDLGFRALFGGQVLGQALKAAWASVPEGRVAHSFHSYFLLPGDAKQPVVYDVEIVRDGKSFSARRVKAIQNGRNIFYMTASFQQPEEGMQHQYAQMPDVPAPQEVEPDIRMYERNYENIGRRMREALSYHRPIDIRTVDAVRSFTSKNDKPERYTWLRANEDLGDSQAMHQAALSYASDYHFLSTSLQPHGVQITDRNLAIATIDHAMWFHRPINMNEWLLYSMESPSSGGARGLVRGQLFNQQGELVASTMQEGLMRITD